MTRETCGPIWWPSFFRLVLTGAGGAGPPGPPGTATAGTECCNTQGKQDEAEKFGLGQNQCVHHNFDQTNPIHVQLCFKL